MTVTLVSVDARESLEHEGVKPKIIRSDVTLEIETEVGSSMRMR
jgi:hypothetical protein